MSKKRQATKTPSVSGQVCAEKKYAKGGSEPVLQSRIAIQAKKQIGSAVISSSTTELGSFFPKAFSATSQSQTERAMPAMVPAVNNHGLRVMSKSPNHTMPTNDPKVPGAKGIRPTPKP